MNRPLNVRPKILTLRRSVQSTNSFLCYDILIKDTAPKLHSHQTRHYLVFGIVFLHLLGREVLLQENLHRLY